MSCVGEGSWGVLRRSGSGELEGDCQRLSFFFFNIKWFDGSVGTAAAARPPPRETEIALVSGIDRVLVSAARAPVQGQGAGPQLFRGCVRRAKPALLPLYCLIYYLSQDKARLLNSFENACDVRGLAQAHCQGFGLGS